MNLTLHIGLLLFLIISIIGLVGWLVGSHRKMAQLKQFRRDFAAQVSHEFRTPLTIIKGYTETMLEHQKLDEASRQNFLKMIHHHAGLLIQMVNDVLEVARMETVGAGTGVSLIHLPDFFTNLYHQFQPRLEAKQIGWKIELIPPLENIETDRHLLKIIFDNLLENAIKYTNNGGMIKIMARRRNGRVETSVSDTGIGIEPHHQERIFERFYRAHRDREREGTGLGLAIVKHAVESLGGNIQVQSKLGKGSVFIFSFKLPY